MPQTSGTATIVPVILILSAILLAVLGTILPGMLELEPPVDLVLRAVLYVAAIGDVILALFMRAKLKKAAAQNVPGSGGTVQRQ